MKSALKTLIFLTVMTFIFPAVVDAQKQTAEKPAAGVKIVLLEGSVKVIIGGKLIVINPGDNIPELGDSASFNVLYGRVLIQAGEQSIVTAKTGAIFSVSVSKSGDNPAVVSIQVEYESKFIEVSAREETINISRAAAVDIDKAAEGGVKASVRACDMSVIEPSARKKWKDKDANEWNVIEMESGFALCLFSNRYLLFSETVDNLVSVEEKAGGIEVTFGREITQTYFVDLQDLLSKSRPYRGYPAETNCWAMMTYDKSVSAKDAIPGKVRKLKETKKHYVVSSILAAGIAIGKSGAVRNIRLGRMEVHPYVTNAGIYDSNIYLTENDAKISWIGILGVGLNLKQLLKKRLGLNLDYRLESLNYTKQPRRNNAVHHTVSLDLNMKFSGEMTFDVSNKFMRTTDQNTSEQTVRAPRKQNVVSAVFEAPLRGKLGFGVDIRQTRNDYVSNVISQRLDRDELLVGGGFRFKVAPKTRLFVNYYYGTLDYLKSASKNWNAYYNIVEAGVMGRLGQKLTGKVFADAQYRKYPRAIVNASSASDIYGFGVEVKWLPVKNSEVIIFGRRGAVESSFLTSRFYRSTVGNVQFKRTVRKLTLGVGGKVEGVQYPEKISETLPKRTDTMYQFRFDMDYNVQKWLKARAGYVYKDKKTNIAGKGYGYMDNTVTLSLAGMF